MSTALSSYNNDKPPLASSEVEYCADPASGAFFQPEFKKHEDLKQMLDSSKDSLKLEAMKRIIGMIAKGRDASDLFPAVVKNVVSKNIEVKKLVYVYLVRYAEEQQDLALLSISTFQRALKDPNQLIRASALRVLSSIRVSMIVPIVMLAIRDSVSDMSPYVRKTAAHAIPKLYSLDPEQKHELVSIIEKLLCDRTPLVVGSAAMAFSEVCPKRTDLLHRNFRKLCSMLADVDEWGQIVLLGVLTTYAREYFCDPNREGVMHSEDEKNRPFLEDSDATDSWSESDSNSKTKARKDVKLRVPTTPLDADHRLLLRTAKPLLQSRNAAVVMAVAQLFYHAGPVAELPQAGKSLVRLLRGAPEVQSVVLHSIASLTIAKKSMFEPYLKSFFVRNCDPTHIKLLKLDILTNLATETSVPIVLRELQTYVSSSDKLFVAAAIQAIGRLAANIEQVTDTCLNGLLYLLSSKDEAIVGEAVVVVKRVLRGGREGDNSSSALVSRAARLLRAGRVTAPAARAAAAWLLAEHGARTALAPSALAHMLTTFTNEEDAVKLQILTLAVKLSICRPETLPLASHALNLAKYDQSYDVRDRARLLRKFVISENGEQSRLMANANYIFLAEKPAPKMESKFKDRQHLTLGTLSHYVGATTPGYVPLPPFPSTPPSSSLRGSPIALHKTETTQVTIGKKEKKKKSIKKDSFFYESESSYKEFSPDENSATSDDDMEKSKHKKGSVNSGSSSSSSESESDSGSEEDVERSEESSSNSETDSERDSSSNEHSNSSGWGESVKETTRKKSKDDKQTTNHDKPSTEKLKDDTKDKTNLDLLLELDNAAGSLPIMTPSLGGFLSPITGKTVQSDDSITTVSPSYVSLVSQELLSKITGRGLSISYRYTRAPHLFSPKMTSVELTFTNQSSDEIKNIRISQKNLSSDQAIHEFSPIPQLTAGGIAQRTIGIDFADTTQPIAFNIATDLIESQISIKPLVGELVRSVTMSEARYQTEQKRLRGMTQVEGRGALPGNAAAISQRITEVANLAQNASQGATLRYTGQLLSSQCLVLVTVQMNEDDTMITVNCDKMAIGSMLLNEIKSILSR